MKSVLIIEHGDRHPEDAVRLLREHGYTVEPAMPDTAPPPEPEPASAFSAPCPAGKAEIGKASSQPGWSDVAGIHSSPGTIMIARASDGAILDCNRSVDELTGYGREEMIGQNILNLFFFLDPEQWSRTFRKLKTEGEIRDIGSRMWTKFGLVLFVLVSIKRVERDGVPCHVITVRELSPFAASEAENWQTDWGNAGQENMSLPEIDFNREEIGRLIDFQALQDLMNSFYKVTRIGIGINDIRGNIQVATGWQDVCTRFHRMHPETLKNCLESDIYLSRELGQGEVLYKCRNGMWDMATPLVIGGRHIANIFLGQFFFEGEVPDYGFFREQAETYGFDAEDYLAAVDRVPRWSRELVRNVMEFYGKLALMISRLSIGNIQLSQALADQKRILEELRRTKLVVENSPVVLFRWRAEEGWPVEFVSKNVIRFGYTPEELLSGATPFSSMIHPGDLERVASEVAEHVGSGAESFQQEYRIVTRDGSIRWVDDRTVIERDVEGRVTHYQGTVLDISERKRAEEELLLLKYCVENAGIGIFHNSEDRIYDANEFACRSLGYTVEELRRMSVFDIDPFVTREKIREIKKVLESIGSVTHQTAHRRKDGSVFPVEITTNQVEFAGRQYGISFVKDITERKRAEEAILAKTEELERYFTHALDLLCIADMDGRFRRLNKEWETALGYSIAELEGTRFLDYIHPDDIDATVGAVAKLNSQEEVLNFVNRFKARDGSYRWIEWRSFPAGKLIYAVARDITDRTLAEERMQAALAEKIVLLKEVHHRVKNNLQIICSLLDLQADSIPDEQSRGYFRECQNRVRSMALVHERIYRSKDFSSIDFGEYLRDLSQQLFDSYLVNTDRIAFSVSGDPEVVLGVNEAIPCGLIVNELVSNSLKHAFPANASGVISIDFHLMKDMESAWISLAVADNGVGLPDGFDFRDTGSLGLQLVSMLVRQLGGRLSVGAGQVGTVMAITFPVTARKSV